MMTKQFPPEFSDLMRQWRDTSAGLGQDHPIARRLWLLVMATAPAWFVEEMHQMARHMGLTPEPAGCDDDGNRLYRIDDVAAKLGMDVDEVQQAFSEMRDDAQLLGLPTGDHAGDRPIHSIH